MSNELKVAIEAAKAGAKIALKYFDKNPHVETKLDNSPVTKADRESEEIIKQIILRAFPKTHFLAEESGGIITDDDLWIIDPIDGTKNFIRHLPFWSVLLAFCRNREVLVGVSFSPTLDELIYAEKGSGTYINGKKTRVSKIDNFKDAFVNYGDLKKFNEQQREAILSLSKRAMSVRGIGHPYGYNQVALGNIDASIDPKPYAWDVAACKVIIEEAGGKVTNFDGKEWSLGDSTAVATNGLLHDEVIKILNA